MWSIIHSLGAAVSVNYPTHMQTKRPEMLHIEHTLSLILEFPTRFDYAKCELEMG